MAAVCLLQQFNGYYGCPYCYMEGLYCNHRMLYPVRENFKIRKNSEYFQNARSKSFGVKGVSPISKFFGIPWDVPIDPMHQVFLGFAKVLTQAVLSKIVK